jgi:hypothetical protein
MGKFNKKTEVEYVNGPANEKKERLIGRKEAIRKAGLIALSAATMMFLIGKPDKAVAQSPPEPPIW